MIRLGYWDPTCKEPLSYPTGEAHGLLCSPIRGGKTRDYLAQILMTFKGSAFVIDPKLQLCAVTARYRREVLKQDLCVLNPFNALRDKYLRHVRHSTYDALRSALDPKSDSYAADADNLMEGLMPHGGSEVHWVDSSRQLGSGIAMYLRSNSPAASLVDVYKTICSNGLHALCENVVRNGADELTIARLSRFAGSEAAENREIRSVVSTAITQLSFIGNKPIAENMKSSSVDFRQMRHRPMTVYVGLPGRYLASSSKWLRLITNSWANACLQEGRGRVPILGILDEFKTAVGKLGSIETLTAMGSGYGCQLLYVLQDILQLQDPGMYPKSWETFLGACGFKIFTAPRDWTSSDYISRMTGMSEVHVSSSTQSQTRRYLLPEEVRELSANESLVFVDNLPGVIRAGRCPYYEAKEFAGRFDVDPYHDNRNG